MSVKIVATPFKREREDKCDDLSFSSSTVISFELSNGHLYDPRVPTTLDDDQYVEVECELDDLALAGYPSNAEEEERMLMEAVGESMRDPEIRNPQVEQEQPHVSSASTMYVEPPNKDDSHEISKPMETESTLVKHSMHLTAQTISTESDVFEPLKAESNSISVIDSQKLASEPSPVPSLPPPPHSPHLTFYMN
ncbi:hypothetical protein SESBI_36937 [Sesbania bispinosa]|nr:hypothetical protein SESBI_36937 [Sesbania bispinosa]